jgi:hypothetical protein
MLRRIVVRIKPSILLRLLDPEDEGTIILQHIQNYSHHDTASHPRKLESSFPNLFYKTYLEELFWPL